MSYTATITERIVAGADSYEESIEASASSKILVDESVANGETDYEITLAVDVSEIAALYLSSDQDVTFETNDGAAPDDTIALRANEPLLWQDNSYYSNLLTTDITSVFITNASGTTANVEIVVLQDATP